jgi:hypothetical protein
LLGRLRKTSCQHFGEHAKVDIRFHITVAEIEDLFGDFADSLSYPDREDVLALHQEIRVERAAIRKRESDSTMPDIPSPVV